MATTKGRMALSFLTAALAAGSLTARSPQESLRVNAAADRLLAERTQLGLDADHAFRLRDSHSDQLGQTHGHFQQTYKGVKVWGGDAITHTGKDGAELPLTNALHRNITINVMPSLSEGEALAAAQSDLAPKGPFAYAPTTELVVYPEMVEVTRPGKRALDQLNADDVTRQVLRHTLAYHVHTELENEADGIRHTDYLVNAHTGAILKKWNTLHTTAATGTGNSQYNGVVSLPTNYTGTTYELRDMTRGTGGTFGNNVVTNSAHAATTSTAAGTLYTDADNTWGDGANYVEGSSTTAANGETAAVDAMFGMVKSWDFYKSVFGRNGIDGAGTATYSRVHIGNSYDNAFWSDSCFCMTYGDGSSFTTLTALDVAGHEMSHGVCARTANLTYSGESGGLNESNSDIFGTMIEFYARGGSGATIGNTGGNWTIGEQLASTPLRYMYKPSLDGSSPDAWSSTVGSLDVHYSSGPMNRCFYFLSQGATTTGNTSTTYLPSGMTGIGNDKAAAIWFRALTTYLTSSSNYAAARTAAISSAKDLYGAGGAEEQAVWNAFHGINVGAAWSGGSTDTTAPTVSATESGTSGTITFSATASDNVGVSRVEFYVDGALKGTDTTSPYSMTFDSTTLTNGSHSLVAKAYDAAGNVGTSTTATFSVSNATSGAELILNGGFESGATSWTQTSGVIGTFTGQAAHTGSYDAWMCGYGSAHTDYIYQQIAIPSTATGTLTFWLHVDSAETTTTTAYDTLKVQVLNTSGTVLATLATYSNLNKGAGYTQKSLSLAAYKGQTVRLRFYAVEDSSLQTSFVVDDVSVK
ncbi:peptidase M4 [Geothrix oryzae]|uniref:Peptidase M4 n=1 Tax=Geothrix oryzae TaxID=2927975 RepID=A0ABM8DTG9_9BACT|nr:M4 family metallopeptidase [Geothrix oryzae]BDU70344.1 peptidase M4 [Geothrix oryzae]